MMAALIDRKKLKADTRNLLADAQVSPRAMVALRMGILLVLSQIQLFTEDLGLIATFISILVTLLNFVLNAGFVLYCMAIRRGERAEFLVLFDGFSFVGKIIALNLVIYILTFLWSMLFVIPGIIAAYRYRFALYNLCENPEMGIMEALNMSKQQTTGYKSQLFVLDLTYYGWLLLASIPHLIYSSSFSLGAVQDAMAFAGVGTLSALPAEVSALTVLPLWAWFLIMDLWNLVVGMFYLPNYQCVELGYFEIAKETSGIGKGAYTHQNSYWNGPDNMGGF